MVSAHLVQELDNGRLSLSHQGLHPGNMDQFAAKLDATDRKLVGLMGKLNVNEIIKKFAPKAKNQREFFLKGFKEEVKKSILRFINRHMAEILPLLRTREVYTMGNDGYPAKSEIHFSEEKASLLFRFRREQHITFYYPEITLRGERVRLHQMEESEVLVDEPAWILADGEVFSFAAKVEGKKLKPFLKKMRIAIAPSMEETYFNKFVPQIIEKYVVKAHGLDILEINHEPKFRFEVDDSDKNYLSIKLKAVYGEHVFVLRPEQAVKVVVEKTDNVYRFIRVQRQPEMEKDILNVMDRISGEGKLLSWEYMERQQGLGWLAQNMEMFREYGIEVVQTSTGKGKLSFDTPELEMETAEAGDWFDIKAIVTIGEFKIPFVKFRNHILKGRRDYTLPNGAVAILPESWFTDYRHLLEIAEEREGVLSIRSYQVPVLDMVPSKNAALSQIRRLSPDTEIVELALPLGLKAELRTYQKKGYDWLGFLQQNRLGGILADDMGLGKTLQTLTLMQSEKESNINGPSLIVMPTSLVYNWMNEAGKFTTDLRILIHTGSGRTRDASTFAAYDLILTTYGIVRQDLELLREFPFNYVILDESQMIKNPDSKTSKAVRELKTRHRLSLTGTPLENTLMDLWSQMSFLNPGLLGSESFFRDYYTLPIEKQQNSQRLEQLKKLIHPFILRRTKEQVATELPPKVEQVHFCDMTEKQSEIYDEVKNAYRNYLMELDDKGFRKNKLNILAGLQKLRQIAIHPGLVEEGEGLKLSDSGKYREFTRLLEEVISKGAKVLIFSQFVRLLDLLRKDLDKKDIKYAYLDGRTRKREDQVQNFQNNPDISAFLISLKAGGVGLNLTAAEYVFILDPWWNPAVEAQAVDRSHRIGQEKTVFSYKFITRDSIEEKIVKLQERKSKLSNSIVSVEADIFKQLDLKDLNELIQ
jgi:superfamily II DNA or RNA helicase